MNTSGMIPDVIRQELVPEEHVLWSGQPEQGFFFRRSRLFILIFFVPVFGIVILPLIYMFTGIAESAGFPFVFFFFIIFFFFGIISIIFGRHRGIGKQGNGPWYAITNKRAIIIPGTPHKGKTSLRISHLSDILLFNESERYGSILLGSLPKPEYLRRRESRLPIVVSDFMSPVFRDIENPEKVLGLLKKIQSMEIFQSQNEYNSQHRWTLRTGFKNEK